MSSVPSVTESRRRSEGLTRSLMMLWLVRYLGQVCIAARAMAYRFVVCLFLSLVPLNSADSSDKPFLYSSAVSPDGVWIAENFGTDGCCNGGFVLIRKTSEPSSPSDAAIISASPEPGLFMIWRDQKNLSLVRDSNGSKFEGPTKYRGIAIVYSAYENRINDRQTFDVANISKESMTISERGVSADIAEEQTSIGRNCVLSVSARDGTVYDRIGVRIQASINRCDRAADCAGISSKFWIGERVDRRPGVALTSATISNIPSYNRLPADDRMSAVRGSFGGNSAVDLMAALNSDAMDLQYSLNFFDRIVSYAVATKEISNSIGSFKSCVGDADFNWLIHEKTKSNRSRSPNK